MGPINAHADHADNISRLEQHPCFAVRVPGSEPDPNAQSCAQPSETNTSSLQSSYYTAPNALRSNTSSQTYHSANSSPSRSSNISFPYSVRSINSYKSRKNVLYPSRARPLPVAVSSGLFSGIAPEVLIWQVGRLHTDSLQHTNTGLVSAGRVLLQSAGHHGEFSQRVPIRIDEETRCCAELFIALTREVLLKDAIGADVLEGPCELLYLTFRNALFESEAFDSTPTTSNLNEMGIRRAPRADTQGPERVTCLLRALLSVMDAFEVCSFVVANRLLYVTVTQAALDKIDPPALSDEALREHRRQVSRKFHVVKDLTVDQYRKVLGKRLVQVRPYHPQEITATEKVPEDMDVSDWDLVDLNSQSCSNKRSFVRRVLYRLLPLSRVLDRKKEEG
ncbi:hypothetical protein EDB86DRAFT_2889705 [Lactarius hatsudake]|nr:hypothetical protein EDB86DRAFT_2889705 [Lactarius hatsudake]